jgi:hypothetical protein
MRSEKFSVIDFLVDAFLFVLFFCLVFIGDFSIDGFYFLPLVALISSVFFVLRYRKLYRGGGYWLVGYFFLVVFLGKAAFFEDSGYSVFIFGFLASVFCLPYFYDLIDRSSAPFGVSLGGLVALFFVAVFISGEDLRFNFIFGPTILYRVVGFFWGVVLLSSISQRKGFYPWGALLCTFLAVYILFRTGSRGAILVLAVMFFSLYWVAGFKKKIIAALLLLPLLFSALHDFSFNEYRAFNFGGESTEVRISKVSAVNDFLTTGNVFWGASDPSVYVGVYPHNIVVEFLVYYGIPAFVALLVLLVAFFGLVAVNRKMAVMMLPFYPIVVGSLFSGSNMDNYFVIAVLIYSGWGLFCLVGGKAFFRELN